MDEKPYNFELVRREYRYEFLSVSANKEVKKVVLFTETSSKMVFNLALLDTLENGELSDISETNNEDMITVMATVIQIINNFLSQYPENFVIFRSDDKRRQRLYRIIIGRELPKILDKFEIFGSLGNKILLFEPNKAYDFFLIKKI